MKAVSNAYKQSMKAPLRNPSSVVISFANVDTSATKDGSWVDNGHMAYSNFDTVDFDYRYGDTYITLELNRWGLDGGDSVILPTGGEMRDGFVSNQMSDGEGTYASPAVLTRTFSKEHTIPGLTLTFDTRSREWPLEVTVTFYLENEVVSTETVRVQDTTVTFSVKAEKCDKLTVSFDLGLPYHRPRLEEVLYGITVKFTNRDIVSTKQNHDVDPLSRRLPKETMTFTIWDLEHRYDPDNPQGIYAYIDENAPVSIQFGYELPDGSVEWLKPDRYVLNGKPKAKGVYWKNSTQRYIGNLIANTAKTRRELLTGTFRHRGFHQFDLVERGKKRHIRSVHISERVVQKCLCDYCIVPIYSASFIYDNSASLKNRGMDFALRRTVCHLQRHFRKYGLTGGVLLYDFHSYFDTAPHEPLFRECERRIHDPRLKALANSFIEDFGPYGLGLGSQVSQTYALLLPSPLDHFFKETLRIKGYSRYMDDGQAIHPDIHFLETEGIGGLEKMCDRLGLTLNRKKTRVVPIADYYKWLKTKFILTSTGAVVLKMNRESTAIIRRKYRSFKAKIENGSMTLADVRCSHNSYHGHMERGNSFKVLESTDHYFKSIFGFYPDKKGWSVHV